MRIARIVVASVVLCFMASPPGALAGGGARVESIGEREGPPLPSTGPVLPIRGRRRWAIAGELGYNGLAGLGQTVTFNPGPHLALEAGAGMSVGGYKLGVRSRYDFLETHWTPFLGAGFLYKTGTGRRAFKVDIDGDESRIRVLPSPFVQLVGGFNYVGERGFTFTGAAGYARLLRRDNVVLVSGAPMSRARRDALAGSGLVLSISVGRAF